jgi:hypothetical protein
MRFRFRLKKSFVFSSGSGSKSIFEYGYRPYLAQFLNIKKICTKSCIFYVRSSIGSQKVVISFLISFCYFCTVFHFMLDPGPEQECIPVPVPLRQNGAVPLRQNGAVPAVPWYHN